MHHHIPVLAIILDNGGYIGEGGHVEYTSRQRERSTATNNIAVNIEDPRVDFVGLAKSLGAYAENVVEPGDLPAAVARAVRVVKEDSSLALLAVHVE